jgi:hypothetical protein
VVTLDEEVVVVEPALEVMLSTAPDTVEFAISISKISFLNGTISEDEGVATTRITVEDAPSTFDIVVMFAEDIVTLPVA